MQRNAPHTIFTPFIPSLPVIDDSQVLPMDQNTTRENFNHPQEGPSRDEGTIEPPENHNEPPLVSSPASQRLSPDNTEHSGSQVAESEDRDQDSNLVRRTSRRHAKRVDYFKFAPSSVDDDGQEPPTTNATRTGLSAREKRRESTRLSRAERQKEKRRAQGKRSLRAKWILEKNLHELLCRGDSGGEWWDQDPEGRIFLITDAQKMADSCGLKDWHSMCKLMARMGIHIVAHRGFHHGARFLEYLGPNDEHFPGVFNRNSVTALPRRVRARSEPEVTVHWRSPGDARLSPPYPNPTLDILTKARERCHDLLESAPPDPRYPTKGPAPRRKGNEEKGAKFDELLHRTITEGTSGAEWWEHDPNQTIFKVYDGENLASAVGKPSWYRLSCILANIGICCVGSAPGYSWPRYMQYVGPMDEPKLNSVFTREKFSPLPRKVKGDRRSSFEGPDESKLRTVQWRNVITGEVTRAYTLPSLSTLPEARQVFDNILSSLDQEKEFGATNVVTPNPAPHKSSSASVGAGFNARSATSQLVSPRGRAPEVSSVQVVHPPTVPAVHEDSFEFQLHRSLTEGASGAEWWAQDPAGLLIAVSNPEMLSRSLGYSNWIQLSATMGFLGIVPVSSTSSGHLLMQHLGSRMVALGTPSFGRNHVSVLGPANGVISPDLINDARSRIDRILKRSISSRSQDVTRLPPVPTMNHSLVSPSTPKRVDGWAPSRASPTRSFPDAAVPSPTATTSVDEDVARALQALGGGGGSLRRTASQMAEEVETDDEASSRHTGPDSLAPPSKKARTWQMSS